MLNPPRASGPAFKVLARQRSIDAEGSAGAFRGRYDYQLYIFDDVARNEHTRNTSRLVLTALDAAVPRKLTADCFGKV